MLKSVALAMPVYVMSCFKLPTEIISELDSIMLQFWWEKSEHKHGIPWVAWKKLQKAKKDGGLGFRNLAQFNDALLARQALRLLKFSDSLFAKIYKARYYKDDHFFEAKSRQYQSYGWSSILVGMELLKKGCITIIGNGESTRVFKDAWIPFNPPKTAKASGHIQETLVSELITVHGKHRSWNENALNRLLSQEDKDQLRKIYLAQKEEEDKIVWNLTSHGSYSVKTGYKLAREIYNIHHQPIPASHGNPEIKNQVWKLPIMPKLKHFIWRILSKAIGTTTRLNTRGIRVDKKCQRCWVNDESINHLLFTCPISSPTWRLSQLPYMIHFRPTYNIEENIKFLLQIQHDKNLSEVQKFLPFWVMWRIWKSRNELLFNKKPILPMNDIDLANSDVHEWILNNKSPDKHITLDRQDSWTRPENDWLKCNYDASYNQYTNQAFGGWILRDKNGVAKCWGSSNLDYTTSPLQAECKSLLIALQMVWCKGYTKVIFEGDCQILVNVMTNDHEKYQF